MNPAGDIFSVQLPPETAELLRAEAVAAGLSPVLMPTRKLTGEEILTLVVLPVGLTALQILATFVSAHTQQPKGGADKPKLTIKVNDTVVSADNLSEEAVERLIGRALVKEEVAKIERNGQG